MSKPLADAMRLLGRREHSEHELLCKLTKKGHDVATARDVIAECQRLGWQSDMRYAGSLCRTRMQQGYGPMRITQELKAAKIPQDMIAEALESEQPDWLHLARGVVKKKYQAHREVSYVERQKQKQFLLYRGFSHEVIARVFDELEL